MGRALEARDRELAASRPAGSRAHSRRRRALAALSGDVSFTRTVLLDVAAGTWVRMRDGSTAEVKAAVAYAGKREDGSHVDPVRIGCAGEAPGDFWEQAVVQVGRRFDLAGVARVSLGTDGEAQYMNGRSKIPFREVDGWIDPSM